MHRGKPSIARRGLKYAVPSVLLTAAACAAPNDEPQSDGTQGDALEVNGEPVPGALGWTTLADLPRLRPTERIGHASSFDRAGGNADRNNVLYTNAAGERVLLDRAGAGCIYRMWFTGQSPTDWLRIYVDGASAPRLDAPVNRLFDGTLPSFQPPLVAADDVSSGGFVSYVPICFQSGIRVTSSASAEKFYYNFDYRTFSPGTRVASWTATADVGAIAELFRSAGAEPPSAARAAALSGEVDVAASSAVTLLDLAGPATLVSFKLRLPGLALDRYPAPEGTEGNSAIVKDHGRAFRGESRFKMKLHPDNRGALLFRRLDMGRPAATSTVFVDDVSLGEWSRPARDANANERWRDHGFEIPVRLTGGKTEITVRVRAEGAEENVDFLYRLFSLVDGRRLLTDTLDVGDTVAEAAHGYTDTAEIWRGEQTSRYPAPHRYAELLNSLWVEMRWDGETQPSVEAPLGELFAMGHFGVADARGLHAGMLADGTLYLHLPMPFARRAVVRLVNRGTAAVSEVRWEAKHAPLASGAGWGHLKTRYTAESPAGGEDLLLLEAQGSGHVVGVVQSLEGDLFRRYLEGDDRVHVDGARSPVIHGTGTEDLFNGGWYYKEGPFSLPTHGNTAHRKPSFFKDATAAYRFFLGDAIPFSHSVRFGMEHGPDNQSDVRSSALVFYYLAPPSLARADTLDVGDAGSESVHGYTISGQTWQGTRSSRFEGEDRSELGDTGRAHKGASQFTLKLPPGNAGAVLRRLFDQGTPNQRASVWVDGTLVGSWYTAGGNRDARWREEDFELPASLTAGKTSVTVKLVFESSDADWNEFRYELWARTR